jgi:hypothetical protein
MNDEKKETLSIRIFNDPATFGDLLIGLGTQLKMLPKGTRLAGVKLDGEDRKLKIEYARKG